MTSDDGAGQLSIDEIFDRIAYSILETPAQQFKLMALRAELEAGAGQSKFPSVSHRSLTSGESQGP